MRGLFVFLCIATSTFGQLVLYPRIDFTINLTLGTQNNKIGVFTNLGMVFQANPIAIEGSGGVGIDFYQSKYGVNSMGYVTYLESYCIVGYSKQKNSPFYSSNLYLQPYTNTENALNTFSGFGLGGKRLFIHGDLAHFSNKQAIVLIRIKNSANSLFLLRVNNDFKAGPFLGGGTDQGETGTFFGGYYFMKANEMHGFGLNLAIFTPVPDYSKNPSASTNSRYGSRPVLYGKEPYSKLFHGNFFASYFYQTDRFYQQVDVGVDSKKLGGYLQNALHDSFGLYPRFAWDTKSQNRLYFQTTGGIGYDL